MKKGLFCTVFVAAVLTLAIFDIAIAIKQFSEEPGIELTYVPPYGSYDNLRGCVSDVDPADYKVAVYIFVEGAAWWTKPTFLSPSTPIQPDCTWVCDITTGGSDKYATIICAFLLPDSVSPPRADGDPALPETLYAISVAHVCTTRIPRVISFSGYDWCVKASVTKVGPGPNYFSDSQENVWVDEDEQLHVRIVDRNGKWYCAEVLFPYDMSFGYGKYVFYVTGFIGQLDSNAVLGLFTWDNSPEEYHREIDIEFSQWGGSVDTNAQYVVQPWNAPGNRDRWIMPETVEFSTHSFTWEADSVYFLSAKGHQAVPPVDSIIHSWTYKGPSVPTHGEEGIRINLWLYNGQSPVDTVEVIITKFEYYPLLEAIDDVTISLSGDDIHLCWTGPHAEAGVGYYLVCRSTIADSSGDSLASTFDTTFVDEDAAGDVSVNYYYSIIAVDNAGRKSEESNCVGEFDRRLMNVK